ncbi:hypothetical protein LTR28_006602, partial [Elasticomyces elasticus]
MPPRANCLLLLPLLQVIGPAQHQRLAALRAATTTATAGNATTNRTSNQRVDDDDDDDDEDDDDRTINAVSEATSPSDSLQTVRGGRARPAPDSDTHPSNLSAFIRPSS